MTQSAFKTLLLIVGSALGGIVVFVAGIATLAYYSDFPLGDLLFRNRPERSAAHAPAIGKSDQFLGSTAQWSGQFSDDRDTVLDPGPGQLAGTITAGGKPAKGLRLRLMLNGSVMSQWGESGADGRYIVAVPYGRYRIDGYEIAKSSANAALPGKMGHPQNQWSTPEIVVSADHAGRALDLDFVDPVRKGGPLGFVSRTQAIVVAWEPYPGAARYRLQVVYWKPNSGGGDMKYLFEPRTVPVISGTSFNFAEHRADLKKGFDYSLVVHALDDNDRIVGETPPMMMRSPDFEIID